MYFNCVEKLRLRFAYVHHFAYTNSIVPAIAQHPSGFPFQMATFNGVDHTGMARNETVLRRIGAIVGAPLDPQPLTPNKAPTTAGYSLVVIITSLLIRYGLYGEFEAIELASYSLRHARHKI